MNSHLQLVVIGGGPAGLRAAEMAAAAGLRVTVFDAKPSVGRKFLVAGKGGLNLTHGEEDCKEFAFCGRPLKEPLGRTGLPVLAFLTAVALAKEVAKTGGWGNGGREGKGEFG